MDSIAAILAEARAARRCGNSELAASLYETAARAARDADQLQLRIHALRHVSELAREVGDLDRAVSAGLEALRLCSRLPDEPLEHANALRVAALSLDATGREEESLALWRDARERYVAAGVAAGVEECDQHL